MFTHIVLFKLKDRTPARIAEARQRLEGLRTAVETLRGLEVGVDVIHSSRSYDLALITRFDNLDGFQVYREHPAHLPVLAYLSDAAESSVTVDFES